MLGGWVQSLCPQDSRLAFSTWTHKQCSQGRDILNEECGGWGVKELVGEVILSWVSLEKHPNGE